MGGLEQTAYTAADKVGLARASAAGFRRTVQEYQELAEMAESGELYAETDMDRDDAERFMAAYEDRIEEYAEDVLPDQLQEATRAFNRAKDLDAFDAVSGFRADGLDPDPEAIEEALQEAEELGPYEEVARDLTGMTVDQHRQARYPLYREHQNRRRLKGL